MTKTSKMKYLGRGFVDTLVSAILLLPLSFIYTILFVFNPLIAFLLAVPYLIVVFMIKGWIITMIVKRWVR